MPAAGNLPPNVQVHQVHLRKIPLLSGLSEGELQKVVGDLRFRQYAKRDIVLQKGGEGDAPAAGISGSRGG